MPSYLAITKPTRDVSADNRSQSLSKNTLSQIDNKKLQL